MTETSLKTKVLRYLKTLPNVWIYKTSDKFTSGVPDILLCHAGVFKAIELKTGKNKPTPLQWFVLNKIHEAGGKIYVAYSVDDVKDFIKQGGDTNAK